MSFDARHPSAPARSADTSLYPASLAPTKIPPSLLAKVAETYSIALSSLQRSLGTLKALAADQQSVLDTGLAEIARLEQLGLQIQELARVLGGEAPVRPERLDLARAARQALAEWAEAARSQGVSLNGPREPFELDVNGAALAQLLDLGLEYALHVGSAIEVGAGLQGLPARPMLSVTVQRSPASPEGEGEGDFNELHWLLFVQLARALGLVPERLAVGQTVTLMLGFPLPEGSASDSIASPAQLPRTATAAGRHVLLIEPQERVRVQAHRLMHDVGMRVDAVSTLEQARSGLRNDPPDAVVTGVPVDDPRCRELIEEIRAAQPRVRVIELVDDDNAFAFSVPGSDQPGRVGRQEMPRTLIRAMSQELDAAWPA
jgi:hypothetical protein